MHAGLELLQQVHPDSDFLVVYSTVENFRSTEEDGHLRMIAQYATHRLARILAPEFLDDQLGLEPEGVGGAGLPGDRPLGSEIPCRQVVAAGFGIQSVCQRLCGHTLS